MEIISANIPQALRDLPRWLGWRWEKNDNGDKWDKPPIDINNDRLGSSTNSETWCDFTTALKAADSHFVDGIGFALGDGFTGVDFDNCRDGVTGSISPDIDAYIRRLKTYGEVSPSGEGVKLILRAALPKGRRANGKVEAYDKGRYFTVTGHRLDYCPADLSDNPEVLAALHRELIEGPQTAKRIAREAELDERELAIAALDGLSANRADAYHDWLLVGMALHAADPSLLTAWDCWSQKSAKYSAGICAQKWESFNGSSVGIGSLIYWAKEDGWEPPKRRRKAIADSGDPASLDLRKAAGQTDISNARRFVAKHGDNVRYCEQNRQFHVWDGKAWPPDRERKIEALAKDIPDDIWRAAPNLLRELDAASANRLVRFATATASAKGLASMLALVRSELGIAIAPEQLDSNPLKLNVLNGTIDLERGELLPHSRSDLFTKIAPVSFDPSAPFVLWRNFLQDIFAGNSAIIRYVQQLVGYSLTGLVRDHVLLFCYGAGANGKSTFLNTIMAMLGTDYAMKAPPDMLMARRGEPHPCERADLFGKRFVAAIECEDQRQVAESLVKELTGADRVRARWQHQNFFEFTPTHKIWMAANHKPTIKGQDIGIWRRVKMIPFNVRFEGKRADSELPAKLLAELPGILNWALFGCADWLTNGLEEPPEVTDATGGYRKQMDVIGQFIDECCELGPACEVKASDIRGRYDEWCKSIGERPANGRRFWDYLSEQGVEKRISNGTYYIGLSLR
jgi:putative DNA primase/helicase